MKLEFEENLKRVLLGNVLVKLKSSTLLATEQNTN